MKRFFKWTVVTVSAAAGAAFAFKLINAARLRLEQGLERAERIAEDAQAAMVRTQEALGQTAQTVREIRHTISERPDQLGWRVSFSGVACGR